MQEFARKLMSPIVVTTLTTSMVMIGMPSMTYASELLAPRVKGRPAKQATRVESPSFQRQGRFRLAPPNGGWCDG